ncbi:MAG TPA: alpha/beta fold hydrolase [Steroidobacter sp.]|uniref:alpha/beta hydrolase n=1 Tax=Steroidobacter sp. TaxID=1978227 RepID=UPI002ED79BA2
MRSTRRVFGALVWIGACLATSGCSVLVSQYISSRQSFDVSDVANEQQLREQGFSKERFCSSRDHVCLTYLSAGPLALSQRLTYDVEISAGARTERVQLELSRQTVTAPLHGTVLLLHGFRASKEFMVNTALYFRFMGFDVLMPDLLGHGESDAPLGFGIKDSGPLNELLDSRVEIQYPLYVLGNSMGAVAATHLAAARKDIHGLILQAPMPVFDQAVMSYIENDSPLLAKSLTERAIKNGARTALAQAGVSLTQTDIKPLIAALPMGVLVLASPDDPVAPFGHFESLEHGNVAVRKIDGRSHPGMAVIGSSEGDIIYRWLVSGHATTADPDLRPTLRR